QLRQRSRSRSRSRNTVNLDRRRLGPEGRRRILEERDEDRHWWLSPPQSLSGQASGAGSAGGSETETGNVERGPCPTCNKMTWDVQHKRCSPCAWKEKRDAVGNSSSVRTLNCPWSHHVKNTVESCGNSSSGRTLNCPWSHHVKNAFAV